MNEPIFDAFWDNRLTSIFWAKKYPTSQFETTINTDEIFMTKVIKEIQEPDHKVVPDTEQFLKLSVSIIANYTEYQCNVKSIDFVDTLMFQVTYLR